MREKLLAFLLLSAVIFPFVFYAVAQGLLPWVPFLTVINFCQLVWASIYAVAMSLAIIITFSTLKNLIHKKPEEYN